MTIIELTGWKSGTREAPGALGFGVKLMDRNKLFKGLSEVVLELPLCNGEVQPLNIELSPSFWRTCSEIRSQSIGNWMKKRGDCPWPFRDPPKYQAEMKGNHISILCKIN